MWETVFAPCAPGPVSSAAELDRAEAELGFPLPESYRTFCLSLGAGLANGYFRVAIPSIDPETDLVGRSELMAHSIASVLAERVDHRFEVEGDDPSVIERAGFFGQTEAGAFLFWDVVPGRDEYEIWVLDADLESIRFGGADLVDLMRRSRGAAVRGILGMGAAPLPTAFVGDGTEGAAGLH
ncbi:SMI1/KNR4 family protein [Methylobacterium sp. J-068]|uniref:SMI1/KNR4 family protein n=1 Tax=Methylobacterium sp. J-068 TaxID=2836649 RepID=UPI001FBB992F|nr:SMI1/KNR4 family protein [Methylobacterium sp. J-068]MCJ2035814.1 SMI1/KNR4 family protein [Methylobacterium sp. J-068]